MNISPLAVRKNDYLKTNFTGKKQTNLPETKSDSFEKNTEPKKLTFKEKVKNFFAKSKHAIITAFTAIASALAVFFVMKKENNNIKSQKDNIQSQLNDTTAQKDDIQKQLDNVKSERDNLADKLKNVIKPEDFDKRVEDKKQEIYARELNYNPTEPPISNRYENISDKYKTIINMSNEPEHTDNRCDAKKLDYPVYNPQEPYKFTFPASKDMKIAKAKPTDIKPEKQLTNISEDYATSLQWDNNKIARDLMQNFFDGHGQTLDGVGIEIIPIENGKHKVKISGKTTYSPDKAILLGESSKKDDIHAAGSYGEGLKMAVLKLLKEKGADNVNIASNNWNVNWSLKKSNLNDKKVLAYELSETKQLDGNYIEFETGDNDFINSILNSYDRFYHYNNPAFKEPDFENDLVGIKLLDDENTQGRIYIAGQAFEIIEKNSKNKIIEANYEGIKGANIFIKEKPPVNSNGSIIFDASRDRVGLTKDNIKALGCWICNNNEKVSDEDYVKLVHSLHKYWRKKEQNEEGSIMDDFLYGLTGYMNFRANKLKINFPNEKEVADDYGCEDFHSFYKRAGYTICVGGLKNIGMTSLKELVNESRKHKVIEPNEKEKNRILLLKEAVNLLSGTLRENNFFTDDEIDAKIYLFDNTSSLENKAYKTVDGEAITSFYDGLKGFWLDKTALNTQSFTEMLSITLHEMTHKYGGDSSAEFSYRLTDVLEKVAKAITNNPTLALNLKQLEEVWNQTNE